MCGNIAVIEIVIESQVTIEEARINRKKRVRFRRELVCFWIAERLSIGASAASVPSFTAKAHLSPPFSASESLCER